MGGRALSYVDAPGWQEFFMSVCAIRSGAVMLEWTAPLPLVTEWSQDQRRSQRWRRVIIGLDLAKNVFQVHGIDDSGQAVLKRKLTRSECCRFLPGWRRRWSGLKPATPPTIGAEKSPRLGTMSV